MGNFKLYIFNYIIIKNIYKIIIFCALQLGQILQRDVPQINVEICELENAGLVLRICPLEAIIPICGNDIEIFISSLEQHLVIFFPKI